MKIKHLYVNNFKSLVNFELVEPNAFSVFVGPNAAGKSNVFEALEFLSYSIQSSILASDLFGTPSKYLNKRAILGQQPKLGFELNFQIKFEDWNLERLKYCVRKNGKWGEAESMIFTAPEGADEDGINEAKEATEAKELALSKMFSRLFIGNERVNKLNINGQEKLRIDGNNLTDVLWRLFQNQEIKEEIQEWLPILIPEMEKVEVEKHELDGKPFLRFFEKHLPEPLGRDLISDGTYNILALLTAVYQSDEPQFLCIEEPENGLNPYIIRTLVEFFRDACDEKGHCIWLNTHSATLVRELKNEEIILIDKKQGITTAKQIPATFNRHDLMLDELWLSNSLGGGLPW